MGFSGNGAHPRKGAVGFKLVEVPAGRVSPHSSEVVAVLVAAEGPGWGIEMMRRSVTRHHWCKGCRRVRRAWLRCPWAVAGPGRASRRRAEPKARSADGERAGRRPRARKAARPSGPPPTGTHSGRAAAHGHAKQPGPAGRRPPAHTAGGPPPTGTQSSPARRVRPSGARNTRGARKAARPGRGHAQPLGTGRRHDPRLGRQGAQSCNPQGVRDVGGATRPGHSQGGTDEGNDVGGGPAQAS